MAQMEAIIERLNALKLKDLANPACEGLLQQLYDLIIASNGTGIDASIGGTGIATLWTYASSDVSLGVHRLAFRCLTNIMVLSGPMRQDFVEEGYPVKLVKLLKVHNANNDWDAFVAARMLLRCTGDQSLDLLPQFQRAGLAEVLNEVLSRYAEDSETLSPEALLARGEELRLLSTVLSRYPAQTPLFLESLDSVLKLFDRASVSLSPREPPISSLIHCLVLLLPAGLSTGSIPWPRLNDEKLVEVIDDAFHTYKQDELETYLLPVIAILTLAAQDGPLAVKARLQVRLLPSDKDRSVPLGTGSSLAHRLVKSSTDAVTSELKNALGLLLITLSNNSSEELVQNVGYGCASGLLFSMGLPIPSVDSKAEGAMTTQSDFNPITGQHRHMEQQTDLPEMTQAEKEREAERLFVLFERLRSTGVVNVDNPVRQAMESGRVQELEDSED